MRKVEILSRACIALADIDLAREPAAGAIYK